MDGLLVYSSVAVVEVFPTQGHCNLNTAESHESVGGDCEWRFGTAGHRHHPRVQSLTTIGLGLSESSHQLIVFPKMDSGLMTPPKNGKDLWYLIRRFFAKGKRPSTVSDRDSNEGTP